MFKDLTQLYSIGKELGLNKKDINRILVFQKKHILFFITLIIIIALSVIAFFVWDFVALSYLSNSNSTYGHGTFYSSISIKDFRKKNEIKYWLWKKI